MTHNANVDAMELMQELVMMFNQGNFFEAIADAQNYLANNSDPNQAVFVRELLGQFYGNYLCMRL
jgi:hypothetical protein